MRETLSVYGNLLKSGVILRVCKWTVHCNMADIDQIESVGISLSVGVKTVELDIA